MPRRSDRSDVHDESSGIVLIRCWSLALLMAVLCMNRASLLSCLIRSASEPDLASRG